MFVYGNQVIVDYFIGREGNDVAVASANTLKAMEQAKKKPAKYRIAEVIGNLVLNPDRGNSWNAVRSLRSMAATVVSLVVDVVLVFLMLGYGMQRRA